ncbi:hypothetical protein C8R43DRAFT_1113636 [Mycena crocata]|nr:hypothetical protein C8R43DRAFT_1113636 [Mycena crocata]
MLLLPIILLVAQVSALPLGVRHKTKNAALASASASASVSATVAASASASATKSASAAAASQSASAAGDEEGEGNELNVEGTFDKAVKLGGGDVKTDVLFTKGSVGSLEVEFQDVNANTLTVTENKSPAKPPTGFKALETSSFKIALSEGSANLTLQKVDFVFDIASAGLKGVDLSAAKIGKLCTEANLFIIDEQLGELEFEAEENEISLTVDNMVGEWGVFIPDAAAAAVEGEGEGEDDVAGKFDAAIETPAANKKTDILFTQGTAGALEVEVNATAANAVTVKQNASPSNPPAGFLFVDPTTFQISTASATDPATDVVKVDYIFSAAVLAAVDASKGVIGKFDAKTDTFIVDPEKLDAEFEFEEEENEWSLTVKDLNGEWAILIPESAVKAQ